MKKLISLFTSFVVLINVCTPVFADPKGDPLDVDLHPEYTDLLRAKFEKMERDKQNSNYPCVWEKEPDFWFRSDDYRVVRVYNMPHLMNGRLGDNFLRTSLNLFLEARKVSESTSRLARGAGSAIAKLFADRLRDELRNSGDIARLARFLGTDADTAMESFVLSFGLTCASRTLHGISIAAVLLDNLGRVGIFAGPAGLALAVALDIACFTTTKSALAQEKTMNYATLLSTIYGMLLNQQENVLGSNILITAVDERDFLPIFRWNAFRRDDGSWCNFAHIGGLRCAPTARDYNSGIISAYLDIYGQVMCADGLDLEAMDRFAKEGIDFVPRPIGTAQGNNQRAIAQETRR